MRRVLVLGGAGFIGAALVKRLRNLGLDVTAIDRYWSSKIKGVKCVTGDVFDESLLREEMHGQDIVFHLVSTTVPASSNKSPLFDCETNVIGTLHILNVMIESKVSHIVFASSGGTIYGIPEMLPISESAVNFPISAYGISKLSIEKYLYLYSYLYEIKATSLRISNPFGPGQDPEKGQGVCATFIDRALRGEMIEVWGDGHIVRDFIYIDDVIDALVSFKMMKDGFDVLNIGSGKGQSLHNVLEAIELQVGRSVSVEFKPARACDVPEIVLDVKKAEETLGWKPKYSFEQAMAKTIELMKERQTVKSEVSG